MTFFLVSFFCFFLSWPWLLDEDFEVEGAAAAAAAGPVVSDPFWSEILALFALLTVELVGLDEEDWLDLEEPFGLDWFPFEVSGLEDGSLADAVFLAIDCN